MQSPNDVTPDNKGYSTYAGIVPLRNEPDSSGFEKPSREQYNLNTGRVATAPLSAADGGGAHGDRSPRGRAPGAPSAKSVQPID